MKHGIRYFLGIVCLVLFCFAANGGNAESLVDEIDIPFTKYVLDNGLTLIVHEDHKAPIVAVNVWYHVGSKNEKPGKTGFAHLFEHLMFNGSENNDDDYFVPLERVGATDLNGTTSNDRTNYFQNVPVSALDLVLWLESDRMGHLLGAIDQDKLDEQRGVVQNEKRQYENRPYGKVWELLTVNTFPAGHPYSWTVIGSMDDLDAASVEDVHEWFKEYYGAANAVLSVAGDVDAETIKAKVEEYFGDIPSGPPLTHQQAWVAKRTGTHRQITSDRVPQARIYKVWNVPEWGTEESDYLGLASDILASGKTSRLYKRLVYQDQIATDVSAYVYDREIAGQFTIEATAKPGEDLKAVEQAIDEELALFLRKGASEKELERVKTQAISGFVRGIERIGGFGGKSDILARNEVYGGDPAYYKTVLGRIQNATRKDLQRTAQTWLDDGVFILEVHPFAEYTTQQATVDRSQLPSPAEPPEARFPDFERTTLSNGLKVIVAERHSVPIVNFNLVLDAGYAADQFLVPGVASLAMSMLDEGTKKRDSLEISEELSMLGASIDAGSDLDASSVSLSTLKTALDDALDIYADVVLNPVFPEKEFKRLQKEQLAGIQREMSDPNGMASRVFPKLLYGEGHAYSNPLSGSGTEESVSAMTREDLQKFKDTWFKPNHATLIVVGDTSMDEIIPKIESAFSDWEPGDVPQKNIGHVERPAKAVVYLMDRPDALQSVIRAGHVIPPESNPDEIAIETMNTILGGSFTSRINMNLREDKHWTYGARSGMIGARGQRPFYVSTSVQSDKTKETMIEIRKELDSITGDRPPTEDELEKVTKKQTLQLTGRWETIRSVGGSLTNIVRYGLPDDYYQTYAGKVRALTLPELTDVTKQTIHPEQLTWVIVGDLEKIEAGIRELDLGEIHRIDPSGEILD